MDIGSGGIQMNLGDCFFFYKHNPIQFKYSRKEELIKKIVELLFFQKIILQIANEYLPVLIETRSTAK